MFEDYFSTLGDVYFIISIRNPTNCNANKWIEYATYQKYNFS